LLQRCAFLGLMLKSMQKNIVNTLRKPWEGLI
jgi:hypothetical protein